MNAMRTMFCLKAHAHFDALTPADAARQLSEQFAYLAKLFDEQVAGEPEPRIQLAPESSIELKAYHDSEEKVH